MNYNDLEKRILELENRVAKLESGSRYRSTSKIIGIIFFLVIAAIMFYVFSSYFNELSSLF